MTTDNLLPPPGLDFDRLIPPKLGYKWEWRVNEGYRMPRWINLEVGDDAYPPEQRPQPHYSTSMDAALELIPKLAEDDIKVDIGSTLQNTFEVSAWKWDDRKHDEIELYNIIHENPAYAVCMVFLAVYKG